MKSIQVISISWISKTICRKMHLMQIWRRDIQMIFKYSLKYFKNWCRTFQWSKIAHDTRAHIISILVRNNCLLFLLSINNISYSSWAYREYFFSMRYILNIKQSSYASQCFTSVSKYPELQCQIVCYMNFPECK